MTLAFLGLPQKCDLDLGRRNPERVWHTEDPLFADLERGVVWCCIWCLCRALDQRLEPVEIIAHRLRKFIQFAQQILRAAEIHPQAVGL